MPYGPKLGEFEQAAEDAQFFVRHAHVSFVALRVVGRDGLELGGGDGVEEGAEDVEAEFFARPADEGFEVGFGYAADGVDVRGTAVVLC